MESRQGILSLSAVTFGYNGPGRPALQDVWLEIAEGTITAILGPNGSGKTTLLRLLLGLLRPQAGEILLAGQPHSSYARRARSQWIGLVPQDEHIPFDFSVLEYVLLGRAPYLGALEMPGEADRQIALEALKGAGLAGLEDRPLPNLSGGERQLASVARALAQSPRILLLDEPTAHLDLSNQDRLLDILRGLAAEGATVVLTTHDPNLASAVARRAVLMRQGQILASGRTEAVLVSKRLSATYDVPLGVYELGDRRIILLS
jgi:iron complex transport system ATP-binding protein